MNKYAAEKIAQEYYNLGAQLALTKHANFNRGFSSAINALAGGVAGLGVAPAAGELAHRMLSKYEPFAEVLARHARNVDARQALATAKANMSSMGNMGSGDGLISAVGRAAEGAEVPFIPAALSASDQIIASLPGVLGLGAGVGLGAGIYKGLGKLDRRLGLY